MVSIESCSRFFVVLVATVPPVRSLPRERIAYARDAAGTLGRVAVLIASQLRKELSGDVLFDGVGFKVERSDRLALAGPNGAGKTTLLRALAGEVPLESGDLAFEKGARVALHDQRPPAGSDRPLREYVLAGTADLAALEHELRSLEEAMASGAHDDRTLARYAATQARLEHAGGYDWRDRAASVVRGLGFSDADLDRPLRTFSGGELTRASLARALAAQPDLLLLDEPTNHLDIESLEWLENVLRTLDAAVVLVAHDRWFLEAVTTAVLELEGGRSVYFPGAWHVWRRERAARDVNLARTAARQAEQLARLERFVERFRYKASKARQAQSKLKQIERLQAARVQAPDGRRRVLGFEFLRPARSGRDVVVAEGLRVEAGDKPLLDEATFAIERGEHVALVGPNGSGKTTLLETILGRRPAAEGVVRLGHGVQAAYFSQHEAELDERGSVLDAAMAGTGLKRPEAQKLLGQFLFSGWDEHEKPAAALSGGERRRLALAIVVASGANLLVLDEPTNHLDLESREALERALEAFPGTVLLVSHDRALLDAVAGRLLAVEERRIVSYPGGWADYVRAQAPQPEPAPPPPKAAKSRPRAARPARHEPTALELVEREVARAEERVSDLERRLAEDWSDMALLTAHREARRDLDALIRRWEALFEASGSPAP
jgi:ATP-binding cassette subfamily F protein 3